MWQKPTNKMKKVKFSNKNKQKNETKNETKN